MNSNTFKQLLLPFSLAFATTLLIQYFFIKPHKEEVENRATLESGRSRVAPQAAEIHRPLNMDIIFSDSKALQEELTVIQTQHAKYTFTNFGAGIKSLEFSHLNDSNNIFDVFRAKARDEIGLLVALEEKAPFYYELVNYSENDQYHTLIYQTNSNYGDIKKTIAVSKNEYKIDLNVEVQPKLEGENFRVRVVYPSPYLPQNQDEVIQGIYNETKGINKKAINLLLQKYWEAPSLFGIEDKYFVCAMVKDSNAFVQRGYYRPVGNQFASVLEGDAKGINSFNLTFYFGPKQASAISKVDSRLESVLDYGFFAPFSKLLLIILVYLFNYFKNYGIAIILLTLLIKLILAPFTLRAEQSVKSRGEFQRKLQYLQQKYKGDPQALSVAKAELLKEQGMPDVLGCLPLLLQLPIFIALNRVLSNAIELYKAPFLWMSDLSLKDPYYILPLLVFVSMVMHSSSNSNDPRQKVSSYAVALLFAAFVSGFPAGLALFIFFSTIFSVLQTKIYFKLKRS